MTSQRERQPANQLPTLRRKTNSGSVQRQPDERMEPPVNIVHDALQHPEHTDHTFVPADSQQPCTIKFCRASLQSGHNYRVDRAERAASILCGSGGR